MKRHRPRRVVLYGMPRSASSVTLELICQKLGLQNFGEINNPEVLNNQRFSFMYSPQRLAQAHSDGFSAVPQGKAMIPWLQQREPWGIKFGTNHVGTDLAEYLQALRPDHVVITHREDPVTGFLSLCWAQQHQIYHHQGRRRSMPPGQQYIDPVLAESWVATTYKPYLRDCEVIHGTGLDIKIWTKEHIESGGELSLGDWYFSLHEFRGKTVASGFDYRAWCLNIQEIQNIIQPDRDV